jgi:hypothetical protein
MYTKDQLGDLIYDNYKYRIGSDHTPVIWPAINWPLAVYDGSYRDFT